MPYGAVPVSKAKTVNIVSAYILGEGKSPPGGRKNKGDTLQPPDAKAPWFTAKTDSASVSPASNVPQAPRTVNTTGAGTSESGTQYQDHSLRKATPKTGPSTVQPSALPPTRSATLETLKTLGDTPAGRRARSAAEAAAQAFRYIREAAQRSDEAAYATALGVLRHSAKELSDLAVSGALPEDAARAADHVAAKAKDLPGKATDLPASADDQKRTVASEAKTRYNPSKEARPKEGAGDGSIARGSQKKSGAGE